MNQSPDLPSMPTRRPQRLCIKDMHDKFTTIDENTKMDLELRRKLLHSIFGLFLISVLFYFNRIILIIFLSLLLLFGSAIIVWMQQGNRIPIIDWFEETFERKNIRFPGYGAFWYVVGTLLLALSLNNAHEIAAGILTLALGDSAATIFGIRGTHPLPYNRRKTIEGFLAFLIDLYYL